jgi:hypothetical protein
VNRWFQADLGVPHDTDDIAAIGVLEEICHISKVLLKLAQIQPCGIKVDLKKESRKTNQAQRQTTYRVKTRKYQGEQENSGR